METTHLAMLTIDRFENLLTEHTWSQILALITATFVSEDLTSLGSAWLSANGHMTFWVAWWGCFLGIWMGDAGLYALARWAGRPFTEKWFSKKWTIAKSVQRAEGWIQQHGLKWLWMVRFIPGTRLPTYLAAGFLRMEFLGFITVTGLAALVWTTALFYLFHTLGDTLMILLEKLNWGSRMGFVVLVIIWLLVNKGWSKIRNNHEQQA